MMDGGNEEARPYSRKNKLLIREMTLFVFFFLFHLNLSEKEREPSVSKKKNSQRTKCLVNQ